MNRVHSAVCENEDKANSSLCRRETVGTSSPVLALLKCVMGPEPDVGPEPEATPAASLGKLSHIPVTLWVKYPFIGPLPLDVSFFPLH